MFHHHFFSEQITNIYYYIVTLCVSSLLHHSRLFLMLKVMHQTDSTNGMHTVVVITLTFKCYSLLPEKYRARVK